MNLTDRAAARDGHPYRAERAERRASVRLPRERDPAHEQAAGSARVVTQIVYFLFLLAVSLVATSVVDDGLEPTMLAAFGAWALVTLVVFPNRQSASFGLFVSVTAALALRNYSELEPNARAWAFANLLVLLSPFVVLPLRRTRGFPFLHIWCLVEAVYVYVSSLVGKPLTLYAHTFTPEVREAGFRTLLLFTSILVASGTIATHLLGLRMTRAEADEAARSKQALPASVIPRAYVLLLGAAGMLVALTATGLGARLGSIPEAIRAVAFAGGLILTMRWAQGRLAPWHKLVLLGAAGAFALTGLGSGLLYQSVVPGFLLLALLVGHRRKVPWAPLILAVLVLVVLNVNKSQFRTINWADGQVGTADASTGLDFLQYSQENLGNATDDRVAQAASRFENSDLLGYIDVWVPSRYPYFGYQAYTSLPQLLIPRALLPDKGSFNQANEFGREYELIARSDTITSVNTPLHVEAYAAGGPVFMAIIAAVCGCILAFFGFLLRSGNAAADIAGCVLTLQVILTVESGFLGFMLVIPLMLFLIPILWWACRIPPEERAGARRRRHQHADSPSPEAITSLRARARSSAPPPTRSPAT